MKYELSIITTSCCTFPPSSIVYENHDWLFFKTNRPNYRICAFLLLLWFPDTERKRVRTIYQGDRMRYPGNYCCTFPPLASSVRTMIGSFSKQIYMCFPSQGKRGRTIYQGDRMRYPSNFCCTFPPFASSARTMIGSFSKQIDPISEYVFSI